MSIRKRIAIVGGLLFAGVCVYAGSIFFNPAEMPVIETKNTSSTTPITTKVNAEPPNSKSPEQAASQPARPASNVKPKVSATEAPVQQEAVTNNTVIPAPPKCTDSIRSMENSNYQIYIDAENSRYQSALNSALSSLQSRGMGFSGQADLVREQQAQIHEQKLSQIDYDHAVRLAQYECN